MDTRMELILNVYDDKNNVVKTVKGELIEVKFGVVRNLMKLVNIDDIEKTDELLATVTKAWNQVIGVLNGCFPDMTEEDWDNVKLSEVMATIMNIMRFSFGMMLTIPKDEDQKKNLKAE